MHITLEKTGKKYHREWVFRGLDASFEPNRAYGIVGANGSGKSTLLQLIAGHIMPTEGSVAYALNGSPVPPEQVYRQVAVAAPYLELFEELTLQELLITHSRFKPYREQLTAKQVLAQLGLERVADRPVKQFSSGMKQRVKLGLAVLSDTQLLLLDEPVVNLDAAGVAWFHALLDRHREGRLLVTCSNHQEAELAFCDAQLDVETFKP
ncbi:MAG: ABC transporter ATP-binding protein [Bacteroidota bacterium]